MAVGVTNLPALEHELAADWGACWSAVNSYQDETYVNEPLPFAKLPRRHRLTAIAREDGLASARDRREPAAKRPGICGGL